MADLIRSRKITLPDGSSPIFLDGRIVVSSIPQFITVNLSKPILMDGEDYQDSIPRQFSFTSAGRIYESSLGSMRRILQSIDSTLGLRNRRYYLNSDHYWRVRSQGIQFSMPYPGVRTNFIEIQLHLLVMDPYLRDDVGSLYRSW